MMLNINQTKAVMTNDRFVFLLAGAGTGKTRVIVERTKRLVKEGINPDKILIISFTKKSVFDLKVKLKDYPLLITTYHSLCYKHLSFGNDFKLVDNQALIGAGFNREQLSHIDFKKRSGKTSFLTLKYNRYLKKYNLFDYTDLELNFIGKLNKDKEFRNTISSKYEYIFIDEFQDTSLIQFNLLQLLVSFKTNVFCVGDPNQAIYNFRGASKKVIEKFISFYNSKIFYLDLNYRSGKNIINVANNVIKYNNHFLNQKLFYIKKDNGKVFVNRFKCFNEQIEYIDKTIRNYLQEFKQKQIAVIYRNHSFSTLLKQFFYTTYFEEVNFLTIHQAKGLEFEVVFFIGLEDGHLPIKNNDIKEERNLFYVGVTRAKQYLHLCCCLENAKPSRFIKECF